MQMLLVTERLVGSLGDFLLLGQQQQQSDGRGRVSSASGGGGSAASSTAAAATLASSSLRLSPLEIRFGLVAVAETLAFLHNAAGLAHCGLCPQASGVNV